MSSDPSKIDEFGMDILLPAVLAHELRSPIGAVQGFSALIAQEMYGPIGDSRYVEAAQQMLKACQHMESIVTNVLEIAKQEGMDDHLQEDDVDLSELVTTGQTWLQQKIVDANVVVRGRVSLEPVLVCADERRLQQAFLNILDNAIRYTPRGGHIDVEIDTQDNEWIELSISNDLPPQQSRTSRNLAMAAAGGFGLGLYITRCQMKAHGGDMAIFPTQDGRVKAVMMLPVERRC